MGTLGQFITLLYIIGFVGAYFWPIALTLAAGYLSDRVLLRAKYSQRMSQRRLARDPHRRKALPARLASSRTPITGSFKSGHRCRRSTA
jgi:hypothetical protein